MKTAFIIHGSGSSITSNWYSWLKEKLEEKDFKVFLPQFPTGDKQNLENWLNTLESMKKDLEGSIMIGHSLGVPFIINVLNQWDEKIQAAFLVAGFVGELEAEDEPNLADFSERDFNWEKIKLNCERFYVIHSDDDSLVPLEKAKELAENLETEVILVKGGKHFQDKDGFETFDFLLKKIDEEIKNS